ncbi:MAG: alkaline phosphatase family protein [Actinomycetota bacterium]
MAGDQRVLLVGWDAVDGEAVSHLLDEGRLPNLAAILAGGARTTLEGYPGLGDDAHWSSFATGTPPGIHGRFHFEQAAPGDYQQTMIRRDRPGPVDTWWSRLGRLGATATVIDVPKSPFVPTPGVDEVVDWMAHGADADDPTASSDPLAALVQRHRPHGAFAECHRIDDDESGVRRHLDQVAERRDAFGDGVRAWLADHPADVTVVVFASAHCVGHRAPFDGPDGDRVAAEMEALDDQLGRLVAAWGGDPRRVGVLSLLGMFTAPDAGPEAEATVRALNRRWLVRHPRIGWKAVAKIVKARLRRQQGPVPTADAFTTVKLIAPATVVRVNLVGRQRRGIVPADKLDEVCDWLVARLSEMTDATGRRALTAVYRTDAALPGPRHDALGDVVAVWGLRRPGRVRTSVTDVVPDDPRPSTAGDHRTGGWLISGGGLELPGATVMVDELGALTAGWLGFDQASAAASFDPTALTE